MFTYLSNMFMSTCYLCSHFGKSRKVNINHISQALVSNWGHTNGKGRIFQVLFSIIQVALPAQPPPITNHSHSVFRGWSTCTHKPGCKLWLDCSMFQNLPPQLCTLPSFTTDVHYLRCVLKMLSSMRG